MSNLMERMLKAGSIKSEKLSESSFFNASEAIPTDLPILNIAFSGELDGGLLPGLSIVAGESKTFKTMLSLYCMKAYLEKYKDGIALLYDSEFGITPEYIGSFGIDTDRVVHLPIKNIEELKFDIVGRLKEIDKKDKVFIMIDSIGNLASLKEVTDAEDEKSVADMSRAKSLKSLFRIITPHLTIKNIPCLAINHIYKEIGLYPKNIVGGGCVVKGTQIQTPNGLKNIEDFIIGDKVTTLIGDQKVTNIWNPDTLVNGTPECYEIEFEDGFKIVCSENHKFLINDKWIEAKDLLLNMDCESL